MRFKDKVVVVTGGGTGIGLATAKLFAAEGAMVAITGRRKETLAAAVAEIEKNGGRALAVVGDVSQEAEVRANVKQILDTFGRIDVLISNAGIPMFAPAEEYADWRKSVSVNLDGMFYWAQAVGRESMIPNRSGSIVFISSLGGLAAIIGDVGYVTCKHGLVGLTKALAAEWSKYDIRVNCVAPGITDAEMVRKNLPAGSDAYNRRVGSVPLGRMAQPEEQAKAILFLASDDASYITGITMAVDGGQMAIHSGVSAKHSSNATTSKAGG